MKTALLSNVTIESLASRYSSETGDNLFVSRGYNTWMQELVAPSSDLYAFAPAIVFVLLDGRELLPDVWNETEAFSGLDSTLAALAAILEESGDSQGALTAWQRYLDIYPADRDAQNKVTTLSEKIAGSRA